MEIESGEVMNDLTLGLIYAVKHSEKSAKESIIDFLSEYTGTPKQYYSDNELVRIIRDSFVDYLKTADNPAFECVNDNLRAFYDLCDYYRIWVGI